MTAPWHAPLQDLEPGVERLSSKAWHQQHAEDYAQTRPWNTISHFGKWPKRDSERTTHELEEALDWEEFAGVLSKGNHYLDFLEFGNPWRPGSWGGGSESRARQHWRICCGGKHCRSRHQGICCTDCCFTMGREGMREGGREGGEQTVGHPHKVDWVPLPAVSCHLQFHETGILGEGKIVRGF